MPESSSSVDEDSTKKDATLLEDKVPPSSEEFTNVDQANEAKVESVAGLAGSEFKNNNYL